MIKCNECGYENTDGLDYCDACGAKLGAEAHGGSAQPSPAPADVPPAGQEQTVSAADLSTAQVAETDQAERDGSSDAPTGEIKPPEPEPASAAVATPPPLAGVPAFKAKLSIVRGGRKGQEFALEDGNNLVGRWDPETGAFPEVDLDQDDPEAKVSRKHALIRLDSGKITVEDIGSLNGTYVNRQPRLQPGNPVELKTGDELIIGKTFLKLVVDPIS
ncbi:MAG: FHA domain-containing protein [Candidatus Binataceae bacterium]